MNYQPKLSILHNNSVTMIQTKRCFRNKLSCYFCWYHFRADYSFHFALQNSSKDSSFLMPLNCREKQGSVKLSLRVTGSQGGGRGVLLYMGYIGMCDAKGYYRFGGIARVGLCTLLLNWVCF